MESLNNDKKVDSQITSRYTIVIATAKRARQLIDGANPLTYAPTDRAVSIAVKELSEGKLLIKADPETLDAAAERPVNAPMSAYFPALSTSKDDFREESKDDYDELADDELDDDYKEDDYKDFDYSEDEFKDDAYDDDLDDGLIDDYEEDDFDND
jgi:DNA-directed RNA polymerase subunit omega